MHENNVEEATFFNPDTNEELNFQFDGKLIFITRYDEKGMPANKFIYDKDITEKGVIKDLLVGYIRYDDER
jgi:hypothetical protein